MAVTVSSPVTVTGLCARLSSSIASLQSLNRFIHFELAPLNRAATRKRFENIHEYRKRLSKFCVNFYNDALFVDAG
jgi:hypothetical protein